MSAAVAKKGATRGIRLEKVAKAFGATTVIEDVSFEASEGEFVVFVGPSGCGKSTLLRLIAGLEPVSSGRIVIDGEDVTRRPPHERRLAMVFQSYALYPHMTVRQNIAFALHTEKLPRSEIDARVTEAARALQIEPYLDRKPRALSGGQRQRVAIGRAIVRQPRAFLFDEPLSNLDAALRAETRIEIAALHRRLGRTMLYVTHDQVEAMTLADRIVVLRGGRVMQIGTPEELYLRPANLFVAQFIGSPRMNVIRLGRPAPAGAKLPGSSVTELAAPVPEGAVQVGLRPEDLALADPGDSPISGTVQLTEYLGTDSTIFVDAGEAGRIAVRAPGGVRPREGERVGIVFRRDRCHFFDAEGDAVPSGGM